MPRRLFIFDPPERFVAGTTGLPGSRTFFLQARRAGQVVSVVLEKVQVAVLAERLGVLLDEARADDTEDASEALTALVAADDDDEEEEGEEGEETVIDVSAIEGLAGS